MSHKPRKNGTDGLGGGSLDYPNDVAVSDDTLPYLVIVGKPYEYGLKNIDDYFTGPPPSQANTFRLLLPSAIATNDSLTYESFSSLAGSALENLFAQGNVMEAGGDALNAAMQKIKEEVGLADKYAGMKGIMAGKVVKTKNSTV